MKKLLTIVVLLVLAAGYLACGKGYSSPTAPTSTTPTPGATPMQTPRY